jgi:RHH-type transcriptional regulator, proline utilization regulon repressor / proline dehydrogenase / delta 1-pyrroline-5-carboxylate dehydrogenase
MVPPDSLETDIRRFGQTLAEHAHHHAPGILDHRWWANLLLDWGTRDEQFKVQLFRFIDVLPALRTNTQFVQILKEYFQDLPSLPAPLRWLLTRFSNNPLTAQVGTRILRRQFLKMAYTFMAGETVDQAFPALFRLWQSGCACSIDLLGEATVSEEEADHYHKRCLQTLTQFQRIVNQWDPHPILEHDHLSSLPRIDLSIKLSALYSQLDPIDPEGSYAGLAVRLRSIMDLARALPASITFDMEQAELEPLILMVFTRLFSEPSYQHFPHATIALQAYLKHSNHTLDTLLEWGKSRPAPFGIRLVKGAYWDSEVIRYQQRGWPIPVYLKKSDTDANYEYLAQRIVEHRTFIRPAFGTHNIRTIAFIQAMNESQQLPPGTIEYQMLYGMAEPLRDAVVGQGFRLRVYTPIGELIPGMAYLVRRLLENTSNESFIRRQYETAESLDHLLLSPTLSRKDQVRPESGDEDMEPDPLQNDHETSFSNAPHSDFSQPAARQSFAQALTHITPLLGHIHSYPMLAGISCRGPELISVNPSQPDQIIARFPTVSSDQLDPLIQQVQDHMVSWQKVPPRTRANILFHTAKLMRTRKAELAAWEVLETGKPWREADADIAEAIDFLEFYGREMIRLGTPRRLGTEPGELNQRIFLPRGLAVVISPWNFSLAIPTGLVSAALVTGNVVLFKPSERSPMMGYHLYRLFMEAGLPDGTLQFLPGGPEIGQALVKHPDVHLIAFTGSQHVGLNIVQEASRVSAGQRHVKHVIAEMGGKNAIIVDETADLDEAVTGVLSSATGYQGQKCSACSRVIVLNSVYPVFLERLKQAASSIPIGPPAQAGNRMGPLIDGQALTRVRRLVQLGKKDGTCMLDRQVEGPGYYQGPVILTDLPSSHPVIQEEIFGPVMVVQSVPTFSEALKLANNSAYALTGGIYSRSPGNINLAREAFDVGNLYINRSITGSLVGRQPFGGHRLSGIGRKAGGEGYLEQFMVEKVISENTLRRGFAPTP